MSTQTPNIISAWLENLSTEVSPHSQRDLDMREQQLISLERDIKFATDELSRRRHKNPPKFCIDFDVMYEAAQLKANGGRIPFWSSLLFYLNASKQVILPGTLFETISFFRSNSEEEIGPIGNRFLETFQSSRTIDKPFMNVFDQAARSFKQRRLYQKRYIFALLQKKCEIMHSTELGEFDERTFDTVVQILAHTNRKDKIDSNRVDALNFALVTQLSKQTQESSPDYVLVSNSLALRNVQRTTIDPRHPIRDRSKHVVWSARAASIFQCLCAVSDSILHASDLAWEIYQEVVDERRATQSMVDRVKVTGEEPTPFRKNYRSDLSSLIFGVELHDSFSFLELDPSHSDTGLSTKEEINEAHLELNREVEGFLKNTVEKHKLNQYDLIVNRKTTRAELDEITIDTRFQCKKHFRISSRNSKAKDSVLLYHDRAQLVIEGSVTPLQFVSAIDRIRSNIRSRLIKNQIQVNDPDNDTCRITMLAKGVLVRSPDVKLGWSVLSPTTTEEEASANAELLDPLTSRALTKIRNIFFDDPERKPEFFRLTSEYFDASFEGDRVVLTSNSVPLTDEFELFFDALSDHNVENLGQTIYRLADGVIEQNYLPT